MKTNTDMPKEIADQNAEMESEANTEGMQSVMQKNLAQHPQHPHRSKASKHSEQAQRANTASKHINQARSASNGIHSGLPNDLTSLAYEPYHNDFRWQQASKQASKQASEQTSKRASKQASKQVQQVKPIRMDDDEEEAAEKPETDIMDVTPDPKQPMRQKS